MSSARPRGSGPNGHTARPGAAIAIGPWRYSIAGYASVQAWAASRSLSAASQARPTVQPVPRKVTCETEPGSSGRSASRARAASSAARPMSCPSDARNSASARRREARLHDRLLVGEVEHERLAGGRGRRRVADRGDHQRRLCRATARRAARRPRSSCPSGRWRRPCRTSARRVLGGGEGVADALTGGFARRRVGLRDVERRAAADDGDALARRRARPPAASARRRKRLRHVASRPVGSGSRRVVLFICVHTMHQSCRMQHRAQSQPLPVCCFLLTTRFNRTEPYTGCGTMPPCARRNVSASSSSELADRGSVGVSELADLLGVSTASVRRDLQLLEQQRLLSRTHGGAVASGLIELPLRYKGGRHVEEKRRIAAEAARPCRRRRRPWASPAAPRRRKWRAS